MSSIIKTAIRSLLGTPNRIFNFCLLKYRKVSYGKKLKISGKLFCVSKGRGSIVIGNNVRLNSSLSSNPIGGSTRMILFSSGEGKIRIGNDVGISNSTIYACNSVTIEDNVFIGGNTKIYDTDFHWLDFQKRISQPGGNTKPIVIKRGAFVGAHCIILKGVTIGEYAVVGAGSVVTHDIPAGEIWAGNPARRIKKGSKQ